MSEAADDKRMRPVKRPTGSFDFFEVDSGADLVSQRAHDSAQLLLDGVRQAEASGERQALQNVLDYATAHGLDTLAELWADAPANSAAGALWRLYLLRAMLKDQSEETVLAFTRGIALSPGIDPVVTGAQKPATPAELQRISDDVFRGVFTGDVTIALHRAAAFARVVSLGLTDLANDNELSEPERSKALILRAARLRSMAHELDVAART